MDVSPINSDVLQPSFLGLMQRLKEETRTFHDELEAMPFNQLMVGESLSLSQYLHLLICYERFILHLESLCTHSDSEQVQMIWSEELRKHHLILDDIEFLQSHVQYTCQQVSAIDDLILWMREVHIQAPYRLLGILYVMEGSTLGGMILSKKIRATFGFDERGYSYLNPYGKKVGSHWKQFRSLMNALELSNTQKDEIVGAAQQTFVYLGECFRQLAALYPRKSEQTSQTKLDPINV